MKEITSVWLRAKPETLRGPFPSKFRVSSVFMFSPILFQLDASNVPLAVRDLVSRRLH